MVPTVKLAQWAQDLLPAGVKTRAEFELFSISGDAGFRQYFRTNTEPTLIAVSAPPEHEDNPAFVSKSLAMSARGIHVPEVFAVNYEHGFMLLEDLGDGLLLPQLSRQTVAHLYRLAEDTLLQLQQMPQDRAVFPNYSRQLLDMEMSLFPRWFVSDLLKLSLGEPEQAMLRSTFDLLLDSAAEQPEVVVHRDFHSRNLLLLDDDELGVVDFQDAVVGPVTYDLVSLLRDCYIRWPVEMVRERALDFAARAGVLDSVGSEKFVRWFDLMGLQRHIKVLGIFARLWLRDGKPGYLNDLPLVIRYTLEQAQPYPELAPFVEWFQRRIEPRLVEQAWYHPWQTAGE